MADDPTLAHAATEPAVPQPAAPPARSTLWQRLRRNPVVMTVGAAILLLLLVAGSLYLWKVWAVRSAEQRFAAERTQFSTAQRQAIEGQSREMLRLAARPLAWAVRAELLRGNVGQVDDYFREFVREHGVNAMLLVGPDRKVQLATNRKLETQAADGLVSKAILDAVDVTVEVIGTGMRMGVPVMGFDRKLGVLVIDYDASAQR